MPKKWLSPFEVETPKGCEGWQEMYPSYYLFSEERKDFENNRAWYCDALHHPEPMAPFDLILPECWQIALSQYNSRIFPAPAAMGIDHRLINGYIYISPNPITDEELINRRKEQFIERTRYYYENWEALYRIWKKKIISLINELKDIEIGTLPEIENEDMVKDAIGVSSGYNLLVKYNRLIENMFKAWQYHSEFANIGYASYLAFMTFCKSAFPEIDEQTAARMISAIELDVLKPDGELRKLAKLSLQLNVDDKIIGMVDSESTPEKILNELREDENGRLWVESFEKARDPWFYFSVGMGNFYHKHRAWNDDLTIPLRAIADYIKMAKRGESIDRPFDELRKQRDEITKGYRELLSSIEEKDTFDQLLKTGRTSFPFLENHVFYVEHWHHAIFWNKIRDIGKLLVENDFLENSEDVMMLHHSEIRQLLFELVTSWSVGSPARAPYYLPEKIKRRKDILERLKEWTPLPVVGKMPEVITDPYIIMMWGITSERLDTWSEQEEEGKVKGAAGSPGIGVGVARVIRSIDKLNEVKEGEVLVCPATSPSWGVIFTKINALVTDTGGIMSHAAIVAREHNLPAVVGTGKGTSIIKTGDKIKVDGNTGIVEILERA
ncbi:hypothetical protein IT084_15960 [Desulfallas sp. Bu1-1]|uniref:PEP-utilizing enzyme n=1 Tax=Desulfallas sp. Bu1-1 TaxID=2787620 RepID=UPI00189F4F62|nr:PEP-utilizing enzyme [Desulfallas sp. Bu1-1]MBF7084447.1 hypothetical protein [Desulfallas sp. Bu1-1]